MNTPEKSRFPERERPTTKATMDEPQEEFIADAANTKKDDEPNPDEAKAEPERRPKRSPSELR